LSTIINSGYITNEGLSVLYSLINTKEAFDLDVFKFGVGTKSDYIYKIIDLSDRVFSYNNTTKTFTLSSGDSLPVIDITEYPYISINDVVYIVDSYSTTTIKITTSYTIGTGNITIDGAIDTSNIINKHSEKNKTDRTSPIIANTSYSAEIDGITKVNDTTIEIRCIIPEDRNLLESIYYDEIYLYGENEEKSDDSQYKLLFVAEMTYGSGVYTGYETNVFSIQIQVSNIADITQINYNIDNISIKKDVEAIQLMFLYILAKKNEDLREMDRRLLVIENFFSSFMDTDQSFADYIYNLLKDYVYSQVNLKYEVDNTSLLELNINLLDSINLTNFSITSELPSDVVSDIDRIIAIIPKSLESGGSVYIGGYQNTSILFYVSNGNLVPHIANELVAYMLDEEIGTDILDNYAIFKTEFSNMIIEDTQELNCHILKYLLDDVYHPYVESDI
jgi:hypothetical protein